MLCQKQFILLRPSSTVGGDFTVQGRRKCVLEINVHRKVVFSTSLEGKPGLKHSVIAIETAYRCIRVRTLLEIPLPSQHGRHIQSAVIGKYLVASYGLPYYMNRCNLDKDARQILAKTRLLFIVIHTSNFVAICFPAALASSCQLYAFSNCSVLLRTRSTPFQTRRYYLYCTPTTTRGTFSASFTCFAHNRSFTRFTTHRSFIASYFPWC